MQHSAFIINSVPLNMNHSKAFKTGVLITIAPVHKPSSQYIGNFENIYVLLCNGRFDDTLCLGKSRKFVLR